MTLNVYSSSRNFLFFPIALYFAHGAIYPTGSIIAKLALLMILCVSGCFCALSIVSFSGRKLLLVYSIFSLITLNVVGFAVNGIYEGVYFSQLRNILAALLPFFSFYYLARKGYLEDKHLIGFFYIMLPVFIAGFFYSKSFIMSVTDRDEVVTNTGYWFAALIPYIFLWEKRRVISFMNLLVLIFFVMQATKRGAVILAAA